MRTALLTGATGFIGSQIALALMDRGYEVHAITSGASVWRLGSRAGDVHWHQAASEEWSSVARHCSAFVHAAVAYEYGGSSDHVIHEVNCALPLRVLREIASSGGEACAVVLDTFFAKFPGQTNQPRYTAAKLALSSQLQLMAKDMHSAVQLRLEHVYGPFDNPSKVIPTIARRLLENEPRIALSQGTQERDFIYIADVVTAVETLVERRPPGFTLAECGTGTATSLREFFTTMWKLAGSSSELGFGDIPGADPIQSSHANIQFLLDQGWRPVTAANDGLALVLESLKARC